MFWKRISDGVGDQIAFDVPVFQMSVDEVETGTTLTRKRVRQRNAKLPVGFPLPPFF